MMTNNNRENKDQYLLGDFYAELNPIQNLTLKTLFGINYYSTEFRNFTPLYRFSIYSYNEDHTTVGQGMSKGYTLTWTNTANYSLVFDNHNVEMLVGSESIQYQGMNVGGSNWDLLDKFYNWDYAYLDNTTGQATLIEDENGDVVGVTEKRTVYGGPSVESRRVSYFGRLAYNYAEKYLVNATFRADGSSRFARGNRWGYFPSVSIGWVISEEGFMAGTKGTLDYLKLRASWGQVGNQNIDNFQYASPMVITNYSSSSPAGYYLFGTSLGSNLKGAYPGRLANPNVKWETSEQINLGFDARMINGRMGINADYYVKTTKDWLVAAPILGTAGTGAPFINGGIFRCNKLLQELDRIIWNGATASEQEANRKRVEGEARVLRAILYFDLVRLFGNIPLLTVPTQENLPQANPDDVYALIADDLLFAAENIPADAYPKSKASENDGRITRWAAKALLGRVYLYYTGYYGKPDLVGKVTGQQALQHLEDVIASEEYGLLDNFRDLWPASSIKVKIDSEGRRVADGASNYQRGHKESVLVLKFNYTQDYNGNLDGNRWLVLMGLRNYSVFPYGRGWGACTVHPSIVNAYGDGDSRRSASIIDLKAESIEDGFDKLDDQREYTGYSVKKYTPMSKWEVKSDGSMELVDEVFGLGGGDFQISQYQDWVVIRYADVLLMAAELGSSNATQYLNDVRRRAYTTDGVLDPNFTELTATKENILKERQLELAFEGVRYWDLLRQG